MNTQRKIFLINFETEKKEKIKIKIDGSEQRKNRGEKKISP